MCIYYSERRQRFSNSLRGQIQTDRQTDKRQKNLLNSCACCRVLRTWDVKDMSGSRDSQNLRELEMLLMQLPAPVRARLQVRFGMYTLFACVRFVLCMLEMLCMYIYIYIHMHVRRSGSLTGSVFSMRSTCSSHTYTHTYIHTYIYTYTHTHSQEQFHDRLRDLNEIYLQLGRWPEAVFADPLTGRLQREALAQVFVCMYICIYIYI
jgi:hypothetical protein